MIEEMFSSLGNIVDDLIPSKEDIGNILKKLDNNEELDSYDLLVLERVRLCNNIINFRGDKK